MWRRGWPGVASLAWAALLLAGCAAPDSRPEGALAGDAAVGVPALPPQVELESVPFFPQQEHQCGPAALATTLVAAGVKVTPDELARDVFLPERAGSLQTEMIASARRRGRLVYLLDPSLMAVQAEIAAGRPVLLLQKLGAGPVPGWHYAVVVGYDRVRNTFVLRSGAERRLELSGNRLNQTWSRAGSWAAVLLQLGELPEHPEVKRYMQAAGALEAIGRRDDAARAYGAAAAHWPDAALPRFGLANIAFAQGDYVEAEKGFGEAAALDPDDVAARNNRAEALLAMGCPQRARVAATAALQKAGQGPLRVSVQDTLRRAEAATVRDDPLSCPAP